MGIKITGLKLGNRWMQRLNQMASKTVYLSLRQRVIYMSNPRGRFVCAVGTEAAAMHPNFRQAESSISDRLVWNCGSAISDKMAILGGRACVSRKIGHCLKSVINIAFSIDSRFHFQLLIPRHKKMT